MYGAEKSLKLKQKSNIIEPGQVFPVSPKLAHNHNNFLANLGAKALLFGTVFLLLQSFKQLEYEKRSSS
jgi:hypothetical protein